MGDERADKDGPDVSIAVPNLPGGSRDEFDAEAYLKANPDVAAAIARGAFGGDPYQHWLQFGQREGRTFPKKGNSGASSSGSGAASSSGSGAGGGSFRDRVTETIKAAYPTKSKDAAWLAQQVAYFEAKNASKELMGNGQPADEAYWLKRAAGWQAGGSDVAEAGDYSPGGKYGPGSEASTRSGGSFSSLLGGGDGPDPFGYTNGSLLTPWLEEHKNLYGDAPTFKPIEDFQAPTPKELESFKLPTWQEVLANDPGVQFRIDQGEKQLQNSAAAKGVLYHGNTLKGILDYGQEAASQEYGAAANRALGVAGFNNDATQTNNTNRFNAASVPYQYKFNQNLASNAQNASAYDKNVSNSFSQYLQRYNQFRNNQNDQYSRLVGLSSLG